MKTAKRALIFACAALAAASALGQNGGGKATFKEFTIKKQTESYGGSHALYQDIAIPATANYVIAGSARTADGHIKVFAGHIGQAAQDKLKAALKAGRAKTEQTRQITLITEMFMTTPSPTNGRSQSQNNLKQLGIGVHSMVLIGLLRPMDKGRYKEFATYRLINARVDRLPSRAGKPVPTGSVKFVIDGVAPSTAIGTDGGIWRGISSG